MLGTASNPFILVERRGRYTTITSLGYWHFGLL